MNINLIHKKPVGQTTPTNAVEKKSVATRHKMLFTSLKLAGLMAVGNLIGSCSDGVGVDIANPYTKINDKPIVLKASQTGTYGEFTFKVKDIIYYPELIGPEPLAMFEFTIRGQSGKGGIRPGEEKIIYTDKTNVAGKIKCYKINIWSDSDRDLEFDLYKMN